MYAKYTYPVGATQVNIINDLVLILTGTTDKALLSHGTSGSSPNVPASTATFIDSSVRPAGWTKHSLAYSQADSKAVVLRAPWDDSNLAGINPGTINAAQYKFCEIISRDTTSIGVNGAEFFTTDNPTVNTNSTPYAMFNDQKLNLTAGGYILISASNRHIALFSFDGTNYGASGNYPRCGMNGVFERTRNSNWDTNSNAYPPVVIIGPCVNAGSTNQATFNNWSCVRYKNNANATDFTNTYGGVGFSINSNADASFWSTSVAIQAGYVACNVASKSSDLVTTIHGLFPIVVSAGIYGHLGGEISNFADIWVTTTNFGRAEDEVVVNGNTYVIWTDTTTNGSGIGSRYAVRKG